jgi:hypothetical protein
MLELNRTTSMHEINLTVMALSAIVGFTMTAKHFQLYKSALKKLENSGVDVRKYKLGLMDYGSGGALCNINLLLQSVHIENNPEFASDLRLSKKIYKLTPLVFIPLIALFIIEIYVK